MMGSPARISGADTRGLHGAGHRRPPPTRQSLRGLGRRLGRLDFHRGTPRSLMAAEERAMVYELLGRPDKAVSVVIPG